jgi:hypothetical protein
MSRSSDVHALAKKLATPLTLDLGVTDSEEVARLLAILEQLARLGEAATPAAPAVIPLAAVFGHERGAIDALTAMIPEIVARDFVEALRDPTRSGITAAALAAIASNAEGAVFEDPTLFPFLDVMRDTAVPGLIEHARGPHRALLLHPLGLLGTDDARSLAAIAAHVDDVDLDVRMGVARALAHFGDRGLPYLEQLIDGKERALGGINQAVVSSLARIGTKRAHAVLKKLSTKRGDIGRLAMDLPRLVAGQRTRVANKATAGAREAKRTRSANATEAAAEAKALEKVARQANRGASGTRAERKAAMKPRRAKTPAKKRT